MLRVAPRVPHHTVVLARVVANVPWAVVVLEFPRVDQSTVGHPCVIGRDRATVARLSAFESRHRARQGIVVADVEGPGRSEIADVCEIRPLLEIDPLDQFGDDEVQICIPLPVRMAGHVDRDVVDAEREIGTMIQIESAQEVLVGLTAPAMLGDDHSGNVFHHFRRAQQWTECQIGCTDRSLIGGRRGPHLARHAPLGDHRVERRRRVPMHAGVRLARRRCGIPGRLRLRTPARRSPSPLRAPSFAGPVAGHQTWLATTAVAWPRRLW